MKKENKENLSEVVIKNTSYELLSNFIGKVAGIIFTVVILARLLGPELFGIYALAFSIAGIILVFADFGVSGATTRYISDALKENRKDKARSYFRYFLKFKSILSLVVVVIFLLLAKTIAVDFYKNPLLFYPIIFACFYIFILSLSRFPNSVLYSMKYLKKFPNAILIGETSKILLSLLAIFILSYNSRVPGVFGAMAISSILVLAYSFFVVVKKDKKIIVGKLAKIEKPELLKFTGIMGVVALSLIFFASIDTLMLGKFVEASYLGYYRAALGLVLSIATLIPLALMLPIFTQIKGRRLKRAFAKLSRVILIFSIPATIGMILLARNFVRVVYGAEYLPSVIPLYALSFLILVASLNSLYEPLFPAKERQKTLAKFIIIALVLNILLNYFLIKSFLNFGPEYAILGAGVATLISRVFLLSSLAIKSKSAFGVKIPKNNYLKPLLAGLVMAVFLIIFNYFVNLNLILGIIEVISGAIIYFFVLFLIKGITKEDLKLIKFIPFPIPLKKLSAQATTTQHL